MTHSEGPVRVRFAPSPTGYLHIGGLRTALYNYCLARQTGGVFVLRIEDTDRTRFVADAEQDVIEALEWAGLTLDESPSSPGAVGPYRQSERQSLYEKYVNDLLDGGYAYRAFDTSEEIERMRAELTTPENPNPRYDCTTRGRMRNSITLSAEQVNALLEEGAPHVVRLKVEPGREIAFEDVVRGQVSFRSETIDDQVLMKSDGMPTYHLANVVDDALMQITHVIRGEEWLPSTPKHALLYEALGLEMPQMAHLPLILSPTGGKLSKRKAEKQGIAVLVRDYQAAGIEPEALVNYLAMLGWNPGDEREVFDMSELIEAFSLERVGSAGVKLDTDKLRWFNQQHLMRLTASELANRVRPVLSNAGISVDDPAYLEQVASLMRERVVTIGSVAEEWSYFFVDPSEYDPRGLSKRWKADSPGLLTSYADGLDAASTFNAETSEAVLREVAAAAEAGAGRLIHPVRLAISGVTSGPGLFDLMEVLGRETCIRRIRAAIRDVPVPE